MQDKAITRALFLSNSKKIYSAIITNYFERPFPTQYNLLNSLKYNFEELTEYKCNK